MLLTRDHIVWLADQLIRTKGFNAFSYSDISGLMEVRNAAIHYYFPTKTELGVKVIDTELKRLASSKEEWKHLPGDEQLKKTIERFYKSSREGVICLTGSLTPDYITLPELMQQKVKEMCQAILDWTTVCLEKGRSEGNLHFQGEAADRSLLVMSGLFSSLLLSRVLGDTVFDRMMDTVLKDLGASPMVWADIDIDIHPGLNSARAK